MPKADTIFMNGEVITMVSEGDVAEALAIRGGRILALGPEKTLREFVGSSTKMIDLKGRAVTPGLVNSHDHFLEHGWASAFVVDIRYPRARSIREITALVSEKARTVGMGRWIFANVWDESLLEERRLPTRWDIDPVSPNNPVWLKRVFEMGVANSRALEAAGITGGTPNPPNGWIDRDREGEPTGVLRGRAIDLMTAAFPPQSRDEMEEALRQACQDYLKQGFTTVIEPGVLAPQIEAYKSLHAKGGLTSASSSRLVFLHDEAEVRWALDNYRPGEGDDRLRVIGLKFAEDGGVGPRTALMYTPFKGIPANRGVQLIDGELLKRMTLMGHRAGFQVAIHAIGDRAIDIALDAYEYAQVEDPREEARHQIVHCYFPSEEALRRIVDLGVMVNTQTPFIYWLGESFLEALGGERCSRCMPVRTMLERGIPVGISHDATVTPPLSAIGLYSSVARRTIRGNSVGAGEAVTPYQALRLYTDLAARHCFMENRIGTLEPGKYADLVVWDRSPLGVDTVELRDLKVDLTVVEGVTVYARPGAPSP